MNPAPRGRGGVAYSGRAGEGIFFRSKAFFLSKRSPSPEPSAGVSGEGENANMAKAERHAPVERLRSVVALTGRKLVATIDGL